MVTVVDAVNLLKDYSSTDFLDQRGEALANDKRTLVDLLVEQIEFADVIVLNKVDDASPAQREAARKIIRALNPDADLIEANHSRVAFDRILDTGRFDFEQAQQHPLWFKELYGFADHVPETEEYGVTNFVYRARRPFDPEKFDKFVRSPGPASFAPRDISGWQRARNGLARSARLARSRARRRLASGGRAYPRNDGRMIRPGGSSCARTGTTSTAIAARKSCSSAPAWMKVRSAPVWMPASSRESRR